VPGAAALLFTPELTLVGDYGKHNGIAEKRK
jgi:hypothetical protein